MPLGIGMEVDLGPGDFVLDGNSASPPPKKRGGTVVDNDGDKLNGIFTKIYLLN